MADQVPVAEPQASTPVPAIAADDIPIDGGPAQKDDTPQKDTIMTEAPNEQLRVSHFCSPAVENTADSIQSSPAPAAPSPAHGRTGTPARGSRAASAQPDPTVSFPAEAPPHGDQTRRYLNTRVTGVLLEGMKQIAKDQPEAPLKALGEYLLHKSKELEGTT